MSAKHRLKSVGKLILQRVANIGAISFNLSYDKGRLIYDENTDQVYYGSAQTNGFRSLYDIPLNTIVLFESNTARLGYTLLTNINDTVAYITRGSSNGGQVGGSVVAGSTWSEAGHYHAMNMHTHSGSHYHNLNAHNHTVSSHNHRWFYYVSGAAGYTWDASGQGLINYSVNVNGSSGLVVGGQGDGHIDNAIGSFWSDLGNSTLETNSSNTSTDAPSTGTPSNDATSTYTPTGAWRPAGVNYTRQQRI